MTLYAQDPVLRSRQVVTDVAVGAWVVAWAAIAWGLHQLLSHLERPGQLLEAAGGRLAGVGEGRPGPLEAIAGGGRAVARAGASQQDTAGSLAFWLPGALAAIPIVYVLAHHLPGRLRWAQEAAAARVLLAGAPDGRLFALRALASAPLPALLEVAPDPLAAYESGHVAPLAEVELRRLGLRLPSLSSSGRSAPSSRQRAGG
jgi:hypothetical protein